MMIYLWNKWKWKWTSPLAWAILHVDSPDMWGQFSTKVELKIHGVFTFPLLCHHAAESLPLCLMFTAVFLLYLQVTYDFMSLPYVSRAVEAMLPFLAGVEFSCSYSVLVWWWTCWVFWAECVYRVASVMMDEAAARVRCKAAGYWLTQSQIYGSPQNQSVLSISRVLDWSLECVRRKKSVCPLKLQPQCSYRREAHRPKGCHLHTFMSTQCVRDFFFFCLIVLSFLFFLYL